MSDKGDATVSVIIPALNEAAAVAAAVESALEQHADEVIVVDGGSRDATIETAERAGARVLSSSAGRARQQNAGAEAAGGEMLVFLHADNRLGADPTGRTCLEQLREAAAGDRGLWGAFRHRIESARWGFRVIEWGDSRRVRWRGIPFGDQGIFVPRSRFWATGGFPDQPLMEDVLLAKRLRRQRWPRLLAGPVYSSARRWEKHGIVRQTARNWTLQLAHAGGASPERLAEFYRRHDQA
ncbi:TIGR04283 family arsenosugar biosynthesis glycosyltransferase [Roseimaritima sediminicola]|uniref:TIGR04283 family arsenosugar biosynthesis glycosyltransferase n=1 Tax=Roseimaritima sediminicola TaxID=2662066 RepID=UPI0012983749|nr:TIGR04283 family arsenosugar biosynthesis glycosyltransferase [Roseimaritima sediminicola]